MATPRKRWFRQDDSILRDPWTREEKLAVVLLRAYLNTRWARDGVAHRGAGRASLSRGAVHDITGNESETGLSLLRAVGIKAGFSAEFDGEFVHIDWPKYPKEQDYGARSPGSSRGSHRARHEPRNGPSPTPTPIPSPSEEEESPPEPGGPVKAELLGKGRRGPEPTAEAVQFAADFLDGLRAVHEGFKPPSDAAYRGWENEARLLLLDRTLAEAQQLARWLFEDTGRDAVFWRPNVMSVKTFRKQYDRLKAVSRRTDHGAPTNGIRPGPLATAMRNLSAAADRKYGPR